jgi:DNA-binding beta-propeller fold protein YncE
MSSISRTVLLALATAAVLAIWTPRTIADMHAPIPPVNDLPNPYETQSDFLKMPEGRMWGSTAAIDIDKDGHSVWVAERCFDGCMDRATGDIKKDVDPILKFDRNGNLVKSFGRGMVAQPHGILVDPDGNIWISDQGDNAPAAPRGAGGRGARQLTANPAATKGHQVFKFSPDGKLLMTLGKAGGADEPGYFYQPTRILVSPKDGSIFISEGHTESGTPDHTSRVLKFDKTGKFLRSFGGVGTDETHFDEPHSLAMDSQGRLFIGDRNNNRIAIYDQDFKFIAHWYQFGRPSGIYIDKRTDTLYSADSETGTTVDHNHAVDGWKRGIRIGSAKTGKVDYFIPEPTVMADPPKVGTSGAEGIVVDADGVIYGAEVTQRDVKRYVKKR